MASVFQRAMRMCHFIRVLSPLSFHIISQTHDFQKNLLNIKCILIFPTNFVQGISHSKKKCARYFRDRTLVFV